MGGRYQELGNADHRVVDASQATYPMSMFSAFWQLRIGRHRATIEGWPLLGEEDIEIAAVRLVG